MIDYRSNNHDDEVATLTQMRAATLKLEMQGLFASPIIVWTLSSEWTDTSPFTGKVLGNEAVRSSHGSNEIKGETTWR